MSQASDYLEDEIMDHIFGCTARNWTPPSNIYVALATAATDESDDGSNFDEATYTSYAKASTTGASWNVSSGGTVDNATAITFPTCTGGSNTITDVVLLDGNAGDASDNILCFKTLTSSLAVSNGITPQFAIGDLSFTLS